MRPIALLLVVGCAGTKQQTPGVLRFVNQEPVLAVNDHKPIPPPKKFDPGLVEYYWHEDIIVTTREALTATPPRPAANVNSLGDVPNSAWFVNREPTPAQIRRGPGGDGPDQSEPWRVIGVKVGGAAIGITIEDARHDRYVIKFDEPKYPEAESATDVIVQRLTWAMGYNVPENNVVTFNRDRLVLDAKAEMRFRTGDKRKMTKADLDRFLALVDSGQGTFRALASKLIDGKIVGGIEPAGVRAGDANDRVPHELRRDLRGQRLLWAWVDHVDLKSQNSLATYTDDHYIKWYAIDFGESLGIGALTNPEPRLGYSQSLSIRRMLASLVTFGLHVEPWERDLKYPKLRGLGEFESTMFEPGAWESNHHWRPMETADRFDEFWAAEKLMRLSRAHIEAAVEAGRYTDPRAAAYIVQTLLERQRKIGRYAFSRVAPLSRFDVSERGTRLDLCFDDLWLVYGYGMPRDTVYSVRSFDYAGRMLGAAARYRASASRVCIPNVATGADHEAYTMVKLDVRQMPPMFVHLARGPRGMRVIGIDRR